MSILIKGLNKMSECDYQPVIIDWVEGAVWNITRTKKIGEMQNVPAPHGRLIDADELKIQVHVMNWGAKHYPDKFMDEVVHAPTIIEAEE